MEFKYIILMMSSFFIGGVFGILIFSIHNWSKWEVVEENKCMEMVQTNPLTGYVSRGKVFVDVFKKTNKRNGKVKYKSIARS